MVKLVLLFGAPFPKMVLLFGAHNSKKWSTILLNGSPFWSFVQQILQCSKWSMILVSKNDMVLFSSPFFYQKVDECISFNPLILYFTHRRNEERGQGGPRVPPIRSKIGPKRSKVGPFWSVIFLENISRKFNFRS